MAELDDIYRLRTETEESIRQFFADQEIAAITRANAPKEFQQATPRVEIKMSIGAATGHRFLCPDGIARFDRWRVTISVQCITRPANDGQSLLHEQFCARVRQIMATLAQESWSDTDHFPNVRIAEPLRDTGDQNTLKASEGIEYTVINFSGTLCIRENAWPPAT